MAHPFEATTGDPRIKPAFAAALLLHTLLLLLPVFRGASTSSSLPAADELDAMQVTFEGSAQGGPAPGGGSPEPDPRGPERTTVEQPLPAPERSKPVVRAPVREERDTLAEERVDDPDDDPASGFDLLAATEAEPSAYPALARGPRKLLIESRAPQTATDPNAAAQPAAVGSARGLGPGAHGGPGGLGRGNGRGSGAGGVVSQAFAFGGPSGAFRADVCLVPEGTKSVRKLENCPHVATFFTDALNVPPRRFTEGFPGVSDRSEWFAIRFRGAFRVRKGDYYTFRLLSDDGAVLWIDGHVIIDNDGHHGPQSKQTTIQLEAGEHELFVKYYQGPREILALQLFVSGSDDQEKLFGPEL